MKRQGQASNSSGLGRIAPLPDSNPTRGRPLCNRKKMMGRNVNPGLTEPKEIRLGSMDLDSRLMFYYVFELIFERYFKLAKK